MCQLDIKYGWKISLDELNQRRITRVPGKKKWTPKYVFIFMILRRVFCNLINKTNYPSLGNKDWKKRNHIPGLKTSPVINIVMKTTNNVTKPSTSSRNTCPTYRKYGGVFMTSFSLLRHRRIWSHFSRRCHIWQDLSDGTVTFELVCLDRDLWPTFENKT